MKRSSRYFSSPSSSRAATRRAVLAERHVYRSIWTCTVVVVGSAYRTRIRPDEPGSGSLAAWPRTTPFPPVADAFAWSNAALFSARRSDAVVPIGVSDTIMPRCADAPPPVLAGMIGVPSAAFVPPPHVAVPVMAAPPP